MKRRISILIIAIIISFMNVEAQNIEGVWRAELVTPWGGLPFQLEIFREGNILMYDIINGAEQLSAPAIQMNDSIVLESAVFHSSIRANVNADGDELEGEWTDYSRGDNYSMPFKARKNESYRFSKNPSIPAADISGQWYTKFTKDGETSDAIAVFSQSGNDLEGTFLTATGDYRFLEGEVDGSNFKLSAFDGSHAFLFEGTIEDNNALMGNFYSGKHWNESFTAVRDENFELPDPGSLTYMKNPDEKFSFCFDDFDGSPVCLNDSTYDDKVVIIQIMGSWCPNCMDESEYLAELYRMYNPEGLEIIALAFERETDKAIAKTNFDKLKGRIGVDYPMLLAGTSSKRDASQALPQLSKVIAFPTTLIVNKNKEVVWLHTGFNGPATGYLYLDFKHKMQQVIEDLL